MDKLTIGTSTGIQRVEKMFNNCRQENRAALIVYFCAGYPDLDFSEQLVNAAIDGGADMVEIGIPFSDPLADGPAIQMAAQEALAHGTKVRHALAVGERIRNNHDLPLIVMTYFNPVFNFGTRPFAVEMQTCGIDGIIVPDLSLEESREFAGLADEYGLCFIPFAAPTGTPERLAEASMTGSGFIYCLSRAGITGEQLQAFDEAKRLSARMRDITSKPLALGFGIASPADIAEVARFYDGVIVGSALVRLVQQHRHDRELCLQKVKEYVTALKQACVRDCLLTAADKQ